MNCSHCKIAAPENLVLLSKTWICPVCTEKPFEHFLPLKEELSSKYAQCIQVEGTRLLYISDLENNLWKIEQHFRECLDMANPYCTITLVLPAHIEKLRGEYDGVYIDDDILGKKELINALPIKETGYVKFVEPIKQNILTLS